MQTTITMEGIGNFKRVRIAKLAIPKGFIGMGMTLHMKNDMDHQVLRLNYTLKRKLRTHINWLCRNVFVSEFSHLWSGFAHLSQLVVIIWVCCVNVINYSRDHRVLKKSSCSLKTKEEKNGGFYLNSVWTKKKRKYKWL